MIWTVAGLVAVLLVVAWQVGRQVRKATTGATPPTDAPEPPRAIPVREAGSRSPAAQVAAPDVETLAPESLTAARVPPPAVGPATASIAEATAIVRFAQRALFAVFLVFAIGFAGCAVLVMRGSPLGLVLVLPALLTLLAIGWAGRVLVGRLLGAILAAPGAVTRAERDPRTGASLRVFHVGGAERAPPEGRVRLSSIRRYGFTLSSVPADERPDEATLIRAREHLAEGLDWESICRRVHPAYERHDPARRLAYQALLRGLVELRSAEATDPPGDQASRDG